ncbi:MAG: alpha/beta fold hydrolase [Spirochaetes bacterium]|nr:alpha/beta fold hydrolase [Spirochaetota bacterium]
MKHLRSLHTVVSILALLSTGAPLSCSRPDRSLEAALPATPIAVAPAPHPYSIEALSKRAYGSGKAPETLRDLGLVRGARTKVIAYDSEGLRLRALVQSPDRDPQPGGFPVVIVAHGHIPPNAYSTEESYIRVSSRFARNGYLVVKPDYRGHGTSEGAAVGSFRTIDYTIDVLNLVADLSLLTGADMSRVFLFGHSMGGELALRVLETSKVIKAASIWAGVTAQFPENTLHYMRKRDPEGAKNQEQALALEIGPETYPSLSPIDNLARITVPLVIRHGTADDSVPFEWSGPFTEKLAEAGVVFRFERYEGEDHNLSKSFLKALDDDAAFFAGVKTAGPLDRASGRPRRVRARDGLPRRSWTTPWPPRRERILRG